MRRLLAAMAVFGALLAGGVASASAALPPIKHVFIIVLENESASDTFAANSPAPYLSKTLTAQGAFLPDYFGIGHASLDNYIAMIGGQPPNTSTSADCATFSDFPAPFTTSADGAENGSGCVYPASVPTIASQLTALGDTWKGYMDSMGADPAREPATCAHPAIGAADGTEAKETAPIYDGYATRHDPFMYYHSIIDDQASCNAHVVNLSALPTDLQSVATTPNYSFITPDLCNDGHDSGASCPGGGGLAQADTFLRTWVPRITASPAYQQDGLLLVTFDESETSDSSACCGEIAGPGEALPGGTGPGGGDIGAVLLSRYITPGTVSMIPYNHYSMLGSIEDLFGLPHLGYAQLPGETDFGSDIYTNPSGVAPTPAPTPTPVPSPTPVPGPVPSPVASLKAPRFVSGATTKVILRLSATTQGGSAISSYLVQVEDLSARHPRFRTIAAAATDPTLGFKATPGHTYRFRIRAADAAGAVGAFSTSAPMVVPSGVHPAKGSYDAGWHIVTAHGAWQGHAIVSSTPGAGFSLNYTGGTLTLLGETSPAGGVARVTLDGRSRTLHLHSGGTRRDRVLLTDTVKTGRHHLTITVISGTVALEGYGIASRTA